MKKAISLLLALVMCLSLCACGGGNSDAPETTEVPVEETAMTKEEMLAQASAWDATAFEEAMASNPLNAKEEYVGKIYTHTLSVQTITEEYFSAGSYKLYAPIDELKKLATDQSITIVGIVTDTTKTTETAFGYSYDTYGIVMENVYIVNDIFEFTGKVISKVSDNGNFVAFEIRDANTENTIFRVEATSTLNGSPIAEDTFEIGDEVTLYGKKYIYDFLNSTITWLVGEEITQN